MSVTMTDLFCGAGGSSTGAVSAGVTVKMAANHWARAIETHNTNHPDTAHDCADISQVDPRRYPRTDILWASPECTNHSQAKGVRQVLDSTPDMFGLTLPDAAAERSRATMWDVVRFAEHHRYRAIVVENVVDAARWELWEAWRHALSALGYQLRVVYLNSMYAQAGGLPAPQSRDRMYVVAWRTGQTAPDLDKWTRPAATCATCGPIKAVQAWKNGKAWGRFRAQYTYRCPNVACRNQLVEPGWLPAAAAIDWTLTGQRIGDRTRPLADKTMQRIHAGLRRYTSTQLVPAGGTWNDTTTPITAPMRARTTRDNEGLLIPVEGRDGKEATPTSAPLRTLTTRNETGLLIPLRAHNTVKTVADTFDTFAASGNHVGLLTPWQLVIDYNGPARTTIDVLPTQTTIEGNALATTAVTAEDCLFRMLEAHEIAAGMAFPSSYTITGNKREQVRQAGNAVTPPGRPGPAVRRRRNPLTNRSPPT